MKRKTTIIVLIIIMISTACITGIKIGEEKRMSYSEEKSDLKIVSSVNAIREVDGTKFSTVMATGYHHAGDGGNGLFIADYSDKSLKDNGGTVIVAKDGTRWQRVIEGSLPLKAFGAVGNGQTDDTQAIQSWLNELRIYGNGYAASGNYRFTEPLKAPIRDNVKIKGDGGQQTRFIYDGSNSDIDLFTIGSDKVVTYGWSLEGFNIDSTTQMTSGVSLKLNNLKHSAVVSDVSFSSVSGIQGRNLWDGIWFNNCSITTYTGFEINVQNEGVIVNGAEGSDSGADLLLDQGSITFSNIGIHLAGGYGGLYVGQVLVYGCKKVGYLQDNARISRGNREVLISDLCVLDACHEYCALIDDPLSLQCVLQFNAFISGAGWIPPAIPGDGLAIRSLPQGRVSVGSQHIKHNVGNGISLLDPSVYLRIASTTYLVGNGGWGLYADVPKLLVDDQACYLSNAGGDYHYINK